MSRTIRSAAFAALVLDASGEVRALHQRHISRTVRCEGDSAAEVGYRRVDRSCQAVVVGDDDVVFELLMGLVCPSAPVYADALWECGGWSLFSEPMQLRSPVCGRYSLYTPPPVRLVIRL